MFLRWKPLAHMFGLEMRTDRSEHQRNDVTSAEALARVAHEARQPLTAARAAFELIRNSPDAARRERACIVLDKQFVRLARLFDDLIETSRLQFGKRILRLEQVDLRGLVDEVVESVRPLVAEKDQHLDIHLPADALWTEADSGRLQQVVSNLLANGIRYTNPGGRLLVDLTRGPREAVLRVADTGRGITADLLPRIFEPFLKGEDHSEPGLGVGLSIARQLVELHGGTINASSAGPGTGSEFVVTLPIEFRRPPSEWRRISH